MTQIPKRTQDRISESVRFTEKSNKGRTPHSNRRKPRSAGGKSSAIVGMTRAGGIPAFNSSTNTPGSATVDVFKIDPNATPQWQFAGEEETVYNIASVAVGGNKRIQAKQEKHGRVYVVDFEDCG